MPPVDVSFHLEKLSARVEELERRLATLEKRSANSDDLEPSDSSALRAPIAAESSSDVSQSNLLSIGGRAVLGIAGAYLLRAAAESGLVPLWLAASVALLYAAGWLVWAAWPGAQTQLARTGSALTAALILSPLLWEVTVRFRVFEPPVTAACLLAFALLAIILARRSNFSVVLWIGTLTAVGSALVLMAGTRSLVPFTSGLLGMALVIEFADLRGRWRGLRQVVSIAVDLAALTLVVILGDAAAVPSEYQAVRASLLLGLVAVLWTVYAIALAIRCLSLRRDISGFDATQFLVASLLAGWTVLRATRGAGALALGISCLTVGFALYFAAFGQTALPQSRRNFRFFASFALLFVAAGSFLALPPPLLTIWLCLAAIGATGLGVRARSPALELHGIVYLSGALAASGSFAFAARALAGAYPPAPGALCLVAAATALLCAAIVSRIPGEHAGERLSRLFPAILAVYSAAGLAVAGLAWLLARGTGPSLPQLAVMRTLVTCAAAALLAFISARWNRVELVWIAYAAAILGSLKLVLEDLRIGSDLSFAGSLLIYGVVLLLLPRMVRLGQRWA